MNVNLQRTSNRINTLRSRRRRTQPNIRQNSRQSKLVKVVLLSIFAFLVLILGFIMTAGLRSNNNLSLAQTYARQTQTAINAGPTPTPFQPVADVQDPDATVQPGEEVDQDATITPTQRVFQKPEGQVNILLLGSDSRPDGGGFRTDVIVWVSLNPKDQYVSAVSFPRDLFVQIPGMGENRINTAFPRGGFDLLADTFETNFGVRPDQYILVDFNGFKSVINNLGGINVQAAKNLTDSCAKWINASGQCSVGPGLIHMDGEVALWYARSRYSTNDIDRARRAQEVIEAIFNRLMSLDVILKVPDLYSAYTTYVDTDIKLGDIIPLLPLANKIYDNGDVRNYVIGYDHAYDWVTSGGAQVLVPDKEAIQELIIEALSLK